ncbi:MAG TPA: carboxypeptidase-like regulatory domain-containing protein [Flavipsychrobacter sp.]|nr:carboxypeptidase-like regulatory domain-containing protein [Flavipsychrobacter sp.]
MSNLLKIAGFVFTLILSIQGYGQTYNAKLVDAVTHAPVAFANIGILESETGTNSSEDGSFSLQIPDELQSKTLSIFLIGYEDYKISVNDFIAKAKSTNNTIVLNKKEATLKEVIVKPAKLTLAHLGNDIHCKDENGLPVPYVFEEKKKKSGKVKREADTLTEVGTLMKVRGKKTFIDSIAVNVGRCTYPEILYRINIYELINGKPKIILNEPIYVRKSKNDIGKTLIVDVTDRNLVVDNNFVVSIEQIKNLGEGEFSICGSLAGAASYWRIASRQGDLMKIPLISFGISAFVTFSEEIKK